MNKIALIYPGQGAQKVGMGREFYENYGSARGIYDESSQVLGLDMKALCFEENDQLDITEYTQAALVTTCLAMTHVFLEELANRKLDDWKITVTAGLSLGEYTAIAVAGGMNPMDAITTVRKRGILMQNAVPLGEGAMAAVLGLTGETIEEIIAPIEGVSIANYNCPGQIVITGKKSAVEDAEKALKEQGARRVVMLNVSGPFHSPMLVEAGAELGKVLEEVALGKLEIPYVNNVDGTFVRDSSATKLLLERQVSSSVRWEQSIRAMIAEGIDTFVEIGPGKTLSGFLKKIDKSVSIYNVETIADMKKLILGIETEIEGKTEGENHVER